MALDKGKLTEKVNERRAQLSGAEKVEAAAVAYARWQGLTDEVGVDRAQAEKETNLRLDELEGDVEAWEKSKDLVGVLNDRILGGLLAYSLKRSQGHMLEMVKALEEGKEFGAELAEKLSKDTASGEPKVEKTSRLGLRKKFMRKLPM